MRALRPLLAVLLALAAGCAAAPHAPPRPARINHVVFFKLKDPADAARLVRDCNELLAAVPAIEAGWAGTRLDAGQAPEGGEDFDVSFCAGFRSGSDYQAYLDHPAHVAAATKWRPRLEWLRFHDVLDEER
jgi:hypothetical protein